MSATLTGLKNLPSPTYFIDRCVGPGIVKNLANFGVPVLHMSKHYPNDGAAVKDVEWISDAKKYNWVVLTQNPRIAKTPHEINLIEELGVKVFCLGDAQLTKEGKGLYFGRHWKSIQRRVELPGPCFWRIRARIITKDIA